MASLASIDGSLPDAPDDSSTKGIVFSHDWCVEYDWNADGATVGGQPRRLTALGAGFAAPYDTDLEGALRGRGAYTAYVYLFKAGNYRRLSASDFSVIDGANDDSTATGWKLPATWTSFDAVVPGRGAKIDFCYFIRGSEYIRYDWVKDAVSPGYPKPLTAWHMSATFSSNVDGVVAGQGATYGMMGYVFKRLSARVDDTGAVVAAGGTGVFTPGYARYNFTTPGGVSEEIGPLDVVPPWHGLLPLLDSGPAIDAARTWCEFALAALSGGTTPALTTALTNHFMTGTPSIAELAQITATMTAIRARIAALPDRFQYTRGLAGVAQTVPATLTEIGDAFSIQHGPNGRAAVLIHESVHFIFVPGGLVIDVPEWSGATINGKTIGLDTTSGLAYSALTTTQAIANPSSYAAFAQECAFGADMRYGDARRHE